MNELNETRVIFFGASNVSASSAKLAKQFGFQVLVLDTEQKRLDNPLFDGCEKLIVDFNDLGDLGITKDDMLCVITPGHTYDRQAFAYALKTPAFYVGMMGSAKKNAKCFTYALENGCTQAQLDAAYAPIGIDMDCCDADEIGLSIVCQLVKVHNEFYPRELDHDKLHQE